MRKKALPPRFGAHPHVQVRKSCRSERGRDGGDVCVCFGEGILNQRSPPVTPSGVPPSGHIPKIATGVVSSAKPPASGQ